MHDFRFRVQHQRKPSLKGSFFSIRCTVLISAAKMTDLLPYYKKLHVYSPICINLCSGKHILCTFSSLYTRL